MGKDKFGTRRGKCSICEECYEYTAPVEGAALACEYCDHKPIYHVEIVTLGTCGCGKCHGYTSSNECQYPSCDYCDCGADKHIGYEKVETELAKAKQRLKPIIAPVVKPQETIATPQAQVGTPAQSETQYGLHGYKAQPAQPMGMQPMSANPQQPMTTGQGGMPNFQGYTDPTQHGMPPQMQSQMMTPQAPMPTNQFSMSPGMQGQYTGGYSQPPGMQGQYTGGYSQPPGMHIMPYDGMNQPNYSQTPPNMYQGNPQFVPPGGQPGGQPGMGRGYDTGSGGGGGYGVGRGSNQCAGGNSGGGKCLRYDCNRPKRPKEDGSGVYDYCGKFCSTKK